MTGGNFVFVASEAAISPVNVELQLQVKHQNGPVTQYSHHFVYVENVELACATPVKGRLREHLAFWKDIGASK